MSKAPGMYETPGALPGAGAMIRAFRKPSNTPTDRIEIEYRNQAMCLLCISGLTGLPQISLPLAQMGGLPLGLSLIAAHGRDVDLLDLAERAVAQSA